MPAHLNCAHSHTCMKLLQACQLQNTPRQLLCQVGADVKHLQTRTECLGRDLGTAGILQQVCNDWVHTFCPDTHKCPQPATWTMMYQAKLLGATCVLTLRLVSCSTSSGSGTLRVISPLNVRRVSDVSRETVRGSMRTPRRINSSVCSWCMSTA